MKKLIATALLALAVTAQAAPADSDRHSRHMDRMAERLELNETQLEAFKTTMEAQHEKRKALKQSMRESMDSLHQETLSQLSGVLTEEQLAELKTMHEQHQKKGKRHHGKKFADCDQQKPAAE